MKHLILILVLSAGMSSVVSASAPDASTVCSAKIDEEICEGADKCKISYTDPTNKDLIVEFTAIITGAVKSNPPLPEEATLPTAKQALLKDCTDKFTVAYNQKVADL